MVESSRGLPGLRPTTQPELPPEQAGQLESPRTSLRGLGFVERLPCGSILVTTTRRLDPTWLLGMEPFWECWRMFRLDGMPLSEQVRRGKASREAGS